MKRILLLSFFTFSLFHVFAFGQSRTNQITRVCTGSTTPASVAISKAGNITLVPCSGGTSTITGLTAASPIFTGTLTGPRWTSAQGTITTSQPFITHTATWNDKEVTFTNFSSNVTDTDSAAASKLIDLQVGGTSQFNVTKAGVLTTASNIELGNASDTTIARSAAGTVTIEGNTVKTSADFLRSYLASTVTYNNTAALADTALSVTVAAGGIYKIDLVVHSTNVTRSLNLDFAGTATVTNFIGQWKGATTADSSASGGYLSLGVTAAGTDFSFDGIDGVDGYYKFTGSIEVNAAGTFLLRGAQRAAFASDTTILRGSTLTLTKLN